MSFQSDAFVSDSEPTTLCGYICRSNRTHLFLILNQLLFAGIYVVPIGHICFWFWTNYSLWVYMSFQSDTFVSDSEPTTLCGYICRSNRHICFWFWTNYSLLLPLSDVTGEETNNNIMTICLTRPRLNPTIYRYYVHHCTTYKVSETWNVILLLYQLDMIWFKCTFWCRFNGDKNLTVFLVKSVLNGECTSIIRLSFVSLWQYTYIHMIILEWR
jgi:hypothetical protein